MTEDEPGPVGDGGMLATAEVQSQDVARLRAGAASQLRNALVRGTALLLTAYGVSVLFNLIGAVRQVGWESLGKGEVWAHALVAEALPTLQAHVRDAAAPAGAALLVVLALAISAPWLYRVLRRRRLRARLRSHEADLRWWAREIPGVSVEVLADPAVLRAWLAREDATEAPRRAARLSAIREWLRDDVLLRIQVSNLITQRDTVGAILGTVAATAFTVALARLLLLLAAPYPDPGLRPGAACHAFPVRSPLGFRALPRPVGRQREPRLIASRV